jgi:hypothetical protein
MPELSGVAATVVDPGPRAGPRGEHLKGSGIATRTPGSTSHRASPGCDRARVPRHGGVVEPHGTVDRCLAGVLPSRDASSIAATFTCR